MSPEMVIHKWACTHFSSYSPPISRHSSLIVVFAHRWEHLPGDTSYRIHVVPLQALCGDAPRMMWGMDCRRGHQKSGRYTIDPHKTVNPHLPRCGNGPCFYLRCIGLSIKKA